MNRNQINGRKTHTSGVVSHQVRLLRRKGRSVPHPLLLMSAAVCVHAGAHLGYSVSMSLSNSRSSTTDTPREEEGEEGGESSSSLVGRESLHCPPSLALLT